MRLGATEQNNDSLLMSPSLVKRNHPALGLRPSKFPSLSHKALGCLRWMQTCSCRLILNLSTFRPRHNRYHRQRQCRQSLSSLKLVQKDYYRHNSIWHHELSVKSRRHVTLSTILKQVEFLLFTPATSCLHCWCWYNFCIWTRLQFSANHEILIWGLLRTPHQQSNCDLNWATQIVRLIFLFTG